MKQCVKRQQLNKNGRLLLMLPLLTLPFITLGFWALGGGGQQSGDTLVPVKGLNLQLPEAINKKKPHQSKLEIYNEAHRDSAKLAEWMRNDPYFMSYQPSYNHSDTVPELQEHQLQRVSKKFIVQPSLHPTEDYGDIDSPSSSFSETENQVYRKIQEINKLVKQAPEPNTQKSPSLNALPPNTSINDDLVRLENLMHQFSDSRTDDPELTQLSMLMDKIKDIQNPERLKNASIKETDQKQPLFLPVTVEGPSLPVSLLTNKGFQKSFSDGASSGFYGLASDDKQIHSTAVYARVDQTQKLRPGGVIRLRLESAMVIDGHLIPVGQHVFGTTQLSNGRLHISISTVRYGHHLFGVRLKVFDLDGIEGLHIEGGMREQSALPPPENMLQGLSLLSPDPTLKAQAANAGLHSIKKMLSQNLKGDVITVTAGYQVLLRAGE